MGVQGKVLYDLHIHTYRKGQNFNIQEFINAARTRSLGLIGITDAGPGMGKGLPAEHFRISPMVLPRIDGIVVLCGCETSVIDADGNIDLPQKLAQIQDIIATGLHKGTRYPAEGLGPQNNTQALVRAMENPLVDIVNFPYRDAYPTDIVTLTTAAMERGVMLELNTVMFKYRLPSQQLLDNIRTMIDLCEKNCYPIVLGTDAYSPADVGDFAALEKYQLMPKYIDFISDTACWEIRLRKKMADSMKAFGSL